MILTKYSIVLFCLLLFVQACSNVKNPKEQELNKLYEFVNAYCYLNSMLEEDKDWNIATIYFDRNISTIKKQDKDVLDEVINIYSDCPKRILIIAHSSKIEADKSNYAAFVLSYNRAMEVKKILNTKIDDYYLDILFCGATSSISANIENPDYAQMVQIVFLKNENNSSTVYEHSYDCLY